MYTQCVRVQSLVCNMPRRHQWSGCRNQWSDEQLQAALETVRSGKMKAHAAALKFCIPSSTLYDHLKSKSQRWYGGHPTILTYAEERLQHSAWFCRSLGTHWPRILFPSLCGTHHSMQKRESLQRFHSRVWLVVWFLRRWPKLTQRKPEHLQRQRAQGACPEVTNIEKIT